MWKDIKNYEGLYQISDTGEVKSLNYRRTGKEHLLKTVPDKNGYLTVGLRKKGSSKICKVHRLVAEAFIPNLLNQPLVNHKDEDKTNNTVSNLEWCSNRYNLNYGTRNKRIASNNSRRVCQYDLEGNFIAEFEGTREVEKILGFAHTNIGQCCLGKISKSHGFIWRYKY